jgi:hypothetical protein
MDHQNNPDATGMAQAQTLLEAAAIGLEQLESAANLAFYRLAALTMMLARLEHPSGSRKSKDDKTASLGAPEGKEAGPEPAGRKAASPAASSLEERVRQRTQQGLAPPREIYDVRNRARVDWSTLPEWAIAPDPDVFEGCVHEG